MSRSLSVADETTVHKWVGGSSAQFLTLTGDAKRADDLEQAVSQRIVRRLKLTGLQGLLDLNNIIECSIKMLSAKKWSGQDLPDVNRAVYKNEIDFSTNALLIDAWVQRSFSFFRHRSQDEDKAWDLSKDTLVKLLDALKKGKLKRIRINDRLKPVRRIVGLIKTTAVREKISRWRKDRGLYEKGLDDNPERPIKISSGGGASRAINITDIRITMSRMPMRDQSLIKDFIAGFTQAQMAERHGMTLYFVRMDLERVLSELRSSLRDEIITRDAFSTTAKTEKKVSAP